MKLKLFTAILVCFLAASCSTSYQTVKTSKSNQTKRSPLPSIKYLIDKNQDGEFEYLELTKEEQPKPIQGKDQWMRDFYGAIKYPPLARENGVQGIVILDIKVDDRGKVIAVNILKGISEDCDKEALRAFKQSTLNGYSPMIIDAKPVNFKIELPVGFWLG